jgi:hypothetical protein
MYYDFIYIKFYKMQRNTMTPDQWLSEDDGGGEDGLQISMRKLLEVIEISEVLVR